MSPRDGIQPLPGEPTFVLLARDPLAAFLVSIWSSACLADGEAAAVKFNTMFERGVPAVHDVDYDAAGDAMDIALAMIAWRKANDGRWRDPEFVRESTKSELTPAPIALHRWIVEIDYRHDDGIRTTTRGLHELTELADIVEAGPSFYAIAGIRIGAPRHSDLVTVEEAARQ